MKRITLPALGLVVFLVTRPTPSLALVGPSVGDACTVAGSTTPASPNAGGQNLICTGGLWAAVAAGAASAAGSTGYVQFNTGGALAGNANLFWDNTNKYLEIGALAPDAPLTINTTMTGTTGSQYSIDDEVTITPSVNQALGGWELPANTGMYSYATIPAGNSKAVNFAEGGENDIENYGSGTVQWLIGNQGWAYNAGTSTVNGGIYGSASYSESDGGAVNNLEGIDIWTDAYGGTVANMYGAYIGMDNGGATITSRYGVFIGIPTGTATNDYGFYEAGTQQNYFSGDVNTGTQYRIGGNIVLDAFGTDDLAVGQTGAVSESGSWNTMVGYQAGNANTTGSNNTAVGMGALNYATTATYDTALGTQAMLGVSGAPLTVGYNVALGSTAFYSLQGGAGYNTAVGHGAGYSQTTGGNNALLGFAAGYYITTGSNNTAIGNGAMYGVSGSPLTGQYNTAVGNAAFGSLQTTGASNTGIGAYVGYSLTTALHDTLGGYGAGYWITTGSDNTALGFNALYGVSGSPLTGAYNVAIGEDALYSITTTANYNTAVGTNAGFSQSTATNNTLNGFQAGQYITTGSNNTAIGNQAMQGVSGSGVTGGSNVAVGDSALLAITTTASGNTAVGQAAGANQTTATFSTLVGLDAGQFITTGTSNTAIGNQAMVSVSGSPLTGAYNTALGGYALYSATTTAGNNTAVGAYAGYSQSTAGNNTLAGYGAGQFITTGGSNTALGAGAMQSVSGSPLTGADNTAVGDNALYGITTTGANNTAVGYQAGYSTTTATANTLVGGYAGYYITTGGNNTAVGLQAMQGSSGNQLTGNNNTALGRQALASIQTTANSNTAIGMVALYSNTTGTDNTALGINAGYSQTTATYNTLLGDDAGYFIATGTDNTAVGYRAMKGVSGSGLTGNYNVAVGDSALYGITTTAQKNTSLGYQSGHAVTTGTDNTLLGYTAGNVITTGASNIIVGEAGNITTGSSNIIIGNGLTDTTATTSNQLDIGGAILATGLGSTNAVTMPGSLAVTGALSAGSFALSTLDLGNGTAAAPSLAFTSDTGTGLFWASTHNLGFTVNGTEAMRLNSSGYLGIGTTTPASNLQIVNGGTAQLGSNVVLGADTGRFANNGLRLRNSVTNGDTALSLMPNGTGYPDIRMYNSDDVTGTNVGAMEMYFSNSGSTFTFLTEKFGTGTAPTNYAFQGGNVGIGTTSPVTALDVYGSVTQDTYTNASAIFHSLAGTTGGVTIGSVTGNSAYIGSGSGSTNGLSLMTNNSGTLVTGIKIINSGYVGIDMTSPSYNLDVNGTGHFNGDLALSGGADAVNFGAGWATMGNTDGNGRFSIYENATGCSTCLYTNTEAANRLTMNTTGFDFYTAPSGTAGTAVTWTHAANIAQADVWLSPRGTSSDFYINSSGDVGIGTTTPDEALYVKTAAASGVVEVANTNTAGWSDIDFFDSAGVDQGSVGYGNSAVGAPLASLFFLNSKGAEAFVVNNAERMRITTAGNVGIGDSTPSYPLDVTGDINTTTEYRIGGNIVLNVPNTNSLVVGKSGAVSESGAWNTMVGYLAGNATTTGTQNTVVGGQAFLHATTASYNTAFGVDALLGVSGSELTGNNNTALGTYALISAITTAANNTAVGYQAGYSTTTATANTLVGGYAGYYITTGGNNTAVGLQAMQGSSGNQLTGNNNTALGRQALASIQTTANSNTAIGMVALYSNTTGTDNTALGINAGYSQTTATYNTLLGDDAGYFIATGTDNTAVGYRAMKGVSGSGLTGNYNVAVGDSALYGITTTAANNTALGYNAGGVGTAITTGSNDTFVGYQAQSNGATYTNGTALGASAILTASNSIVLGNNTITAIYGQVTSITAISDRRLKKDITPLDTGLGLDFIEKLKPVSYRFKDGDETERYGFIAQDMEKALPESLDDLVEKAKPEHGLALLSRQNNKERTYRVAYGELTAPIVKSIQQQQAEIKEVKAANDNLLHRIGDMKADNDNLRALIAAQTRLVSTQGHEIEELKAQIAKVVH